MPSEPYNLLARYRMLEASLQDSRLKRSHCAVLAVILAHVDEDGQAWPGLTRIAKRALVSRRAAMRAIADLEVAGYLEVDRTLGRSNSYQITPPTGDTDGTGLDDDW